MDRDGESIAFDYFLGEVNGDRLNFDEAQAECVEREGNLARIDDDNFESIRSMVVAMRLESSHISRGLFQYWIGKQSLLLIY